MEKWCWAGVWIEYRNRGLNDVQPVEGEPREAHHPWQTIENVYWAGLYDRAVTPAYLIDSRDRARESGFEIYCVIY